MERNPDIWKPSPRDNAWHSAQYEWWYFDALLDNGYSMWSMWVTGDLATESNPEGRSIMLMVCDPEGKIIPAGQQFPLSETSLSTSTCDAHFGGNYVRGGYPRWELHFNSGLVAADLVYDNLTQGVREPPDGCFIGRIQEPPTMSYLTWVIHPRSRITGKLALGGKEMPVKGVGYSDHQWGNLHMGQAFQFWHWGRFYLPNHTLVFWDGEQSEEWGSQRFKRLWVIKGDRLIDYCKDDMYIDASEPVTDPMSGATYARKLDFTFDGPRVKGTAACKVKALLVKPRGRVGARGKPSGYMAFLVDYDCRLEIDGEKAEASGPAIFDRPLWI